MAIKRDVKVVIAQDVSKVDELLYVYQDDRGIDLYFDILEHKFTFTGTETRSIVQDDIVYAGLTVRKPDGTGFFRNPLPLVDGKVLFRVEHQMTDEFSEIGVYEMHIHLFDKFDNRVTMPPINLEVKPLVISDIAESESKAYVDYAVVDKSKLSDDVLFVIDNSEKKSYTKTNWKAGDIITADGLNNLEAGLERVTKAVEELEIPSADELVSKDFVNSKIEEVQSKIDDIEIPDIEGLVDEEFVAGKIAEATEGLASESFVAEQIANIEFPETDLSNYPTIDEVKSEIQDAIENIELADGKDGKSAYELAVEAGFEGSLEEWLASLKGKDGSVDIESALEEAKDRLQEETINQIWNIQETVKDESNKVESSLEAFTREKLEYFNERSQNYIDRINDAGQDMVELVEGLDANIEDGLNLINSTISQGQTNINTNANNQVERIKQEGQDIIDAVAQQDAISQQHIQNINDAGRSARDSIESTANYERNEIRKTSNEQKESIVETASEKLEEINSILGVTKGEAEELLDTARTEINAHRESIDNKVESSLTAMENAKDAHIDEMLSVDVELQELKNTYITEINTLGTSKVDTLQNMLDTIDRISEQVENDIERAEDKVESLESTMSNVDKKVQEITPILSMLNELRLVCVDLRAENVEANQNIEELDFLHIESDTRIVELRKLIDLAKEYESMLVDYIEGKNGNHDSINAEIEALKASVQELETQLNAIDLSEYATKTHVRDEIAKIEIPDITGLATKDEVNTKIAQVNSSIEEVENTVQNLEIPSIKGLASESFVRDEIAKIEMPDVDSLATKEYVDEAISNIDIDTDAYVTKDELNIAMDDIKGFKGNVGQAIKCATMPLNVFDDAPEPPEVPNRTYSGKMLWKMKDSSSYEYYYICYFYDGGERPYIYLTSSYMLSYKNLGTSTSGVNNARIFRKYAGNPDSKWDSYSSFPGSYVDSTDTQIYHHDVPIYTDSSLTSIYREASTSENISDLNNIVEVGNYYVNVAKNDYKSLQNVPKVDLKGDRVKTILKVYKKSPDIIQEIAIEGIVYTRVLGDSWIGLDESRFVASKSIGKIEGASASSFAYTNDSIKNIFDSCPAPNHHAPENYIDFKYSSNGYCRIYTIKEFENPMFFLSKGSTTSYVGFTGVWRNCKVFVNTGNGWVEQKQVYYMSSPTQYLEIYNNTLPVCKATSYSSSSWDKNTILMDASSGEGVGALHNFNDANKFGTYDVEIKADTVCSNAPVGGAISGLLEVASIDDKIVQKLTTKNGDIYVRAYSESDNWTIWRPQTSLEIKLHPYGTPAFLETPKPVLDLNLSQNSTSVTELSFNNPNYEAKILGDKQASIISKRLKIDGTNWVDINYPIGKEGAILIKFTAQKDKVSNIYGRVFRGNSDGISMFYKQASGNYEIKAFYGGYLTDITPESIEGKRMLLTWSDKKGRIDLYVGGEFIATANVTPSKMLANHSLYLGDNEQKIEGKIPFYMPLDISEFKVYDCYIDHNTAREV